MATTPDVLEHPCGCVDYDYGPPIRCAAHEGDCEHRAPNGTWTWRWTETIWPGETHIRLTKTCTECGHVRGRGGSAG